MGLLSLGGAKVRGELSSSLRSLGIRVVANGLGAVERLHLVGFATGGGEGRQLGCGVVVAEGLLHVRSGPSAGEDGVHSAVLQSSEASALVVVHDEVRVLDQINEVLGDVGRGGGIHLDAVLRVGSVLAEQGHARAGVEGRQVPRVTKVEGNLALLEHGVEGLDVVRRELGLVIVHEVGVAGERNAVDLAIGAGDGLDDGVVVLLLDLGLGVIGNLAVGLGVEQGAELVVREHVDIGCGGRILLDGRACVTFGDHCVLPRDLVLRVRLLELLFHGGQPGAGLRLILGRAPHGQLDCLGALRCSAAIVAGTAGARSEQHRHSGGDAQNLLHVCHP